jgi:hypothetical protein
MSAAPLNPTAARLALLQAVADGQVYTRRYTSGDYQDLGDDLPARTVTAKLGELWRAGWVDLTYDEATYDMVRKFYWHVTDSGKAVLAASKETAS